MKKHALRVLGLVLALFAAGCTNPLNEGLSAPPAGKGVVVVSVGPGARTLLPDVAALYYTLAFTSGEKTVSGTISSGAAGLFELDAGTWSLVVTGYLNAEASTDGANAVAGGNVGGIEVSAGQTTPATVELSAVIGEAQGTLSYDIAFPSAVTVAVLTAHPVSGEPVIVDLLDNQVDQSIEAEGGVTTVEGTLSLSVGYHEVSVYLYDASLGRLMKWDVAHIYKGLITTLVGNFGSGNFSVGPDVTALNTALDAARAARADIGLLGEEAAVVSALDAAIAAAETALADTLATQPEVDAAVTALTTATVAFIEAKAVAQTAANEAAARTFKSEYQAVLDLAVENITTEAEANEHEAAVKAALEAYEELSADAQAILSDEKDLLDSLTAKIADLQATPEQKTAVSDFQSEYSAILAKTVENVIISDKSAVEAALAAYDAFDDAKVQAMLAGEYTRLLSLQAEIARLEAQADADVDTFTENHDAVLNLTEATVTSDDETRVNAALAAYNTLSSAAKALLSADTGTRLQALLDKIGQLGTGGFTVSFTGLPDDEAINLTGPGNTLSWEADTAINFTVPAGFDTYAWDVDGKAVTDATNNTLTLQAQSYAKGTHTVTVKVTKDGKVYAKWARFRIEE
jgi:hypothetical protein